MLELGELRCARIALSGPSAPRALEGIDPELIALDQLPRVPESMKLVNERTTNWSIVPVPEPGVGDARAPAAGAGGRAGAAVGGDRPHLPARRARPDRRVAGAPRPAHGRRRPSSTELHLDELHFEGPGTDLRIGLLPSSHWIAADFVTVDGIDSRPNLPTEEVFTTPDPERVSGTVTATKPLFTAGTTISGLVVSSTAAGSCPSRPTRGPRCCAG